MNERQSSWTPQWQFDFDVHASQNVVSVTPGQSVEIPIMIELIRGEPQPVILTVSPNWGSAGLISQIIPSTVPAGTMATLYIGVSPNTPPGSYMIAVLGDTQGTFASKQDKVTVTVTKTPEQDQHKNDGGQNDTKPAPPAPPPSFSKARAGRPSSPRTTPRRTPSKNARMMVTVITVVAIFGVAAYIYSVYNHSNNPSISSGTTTYVGTQTFCIGSECATGVTPNVEVDSSGDVLGPVLFGKITNGVFTGEADTQDGTVYPMTGTLSGGTFEAHCQTSSHSWTWTMHEQ
jgi:hypothetical protein